MHGYLLCCGHTGRVEWVGQAHDEADAINRHMDDIGGERFDVRGAGEYEQIDIIAYRMPIGATFFAQAAVKHRPMDALSVALQFRSPHYLIEMWDRGPEDDAWLRDEIFAPYGAGYHDGVGV